MSDKHSLKDLLTAPVLQTFTQEDIKKNIPHRDPFLLVDEVRMVENGKKYVGVRRIKPDAYYFKGHFPQQPVVPGVLLVESMSQSFGGAVMALVDKGQGRVPLFLSIEDAKFRGIVRPNDVLEMPLEILRFGKISKIYAEAYVNGKLCAQATLNFILGEASHV